MRQRFLTKVDLPEGSVLTMIEADSREELASRYPELTILDYMPPFMSQDLWDELERRTIDVDDPDPFLDHLVEQRGRG